MRKFRLLMATLLVTIGLVACGDKDKVTNDGSTNTGDKNTEGTATEPAVTTDYPFVEFSLDVDYTATTSYEVSYERDVDGTEASIEDEVKNEKYEGNVAFDKLDPLFKQFTFDATTPNTEVIAQVVEVLKLDPNYLQFELKVRFSDGTEKEYLELK